MCATRSRGHAACIELLQFTVFVQDVYGWSTCE